MFLILEIFLVFICGFNSFVYAVENHNLNNVISHNCTADATIVIRGGKMAKSIPGILPVENSKLGVFSMDTESMKVNGKPILPMFGEIHPSRVPESSWRTDLLKMKSGGLMGVSVYLLWIHVEELQGKQVWSGNRNITKFLEIAKEVGIIVFLRIGPWVHGECRNGGLPDWVQRVCSQPTYTCQTTDPVFMAMVKSWYSGLADMLKGQMWQEGGVVISVQLDNETANIEYLLKLRELALSLGINPMFFDKTGWPNPSSPVPYGSLVPYFGGYADGFWGSINDVYYGNYLFVGNDQVESPDSEFPWLTVELGSGMASSYHRRIYVNESDITSQALVFLGSGVNLMGFYMYHGGTNPTGINTTLQESEATMYANDMPIKSYDFHAPLGEAGQARGHYHKLRQIGTMLATWGTLLATFPTYFPLLSAKIPTDVDTLRCAVRSNGSSGFVFVNSANIHVKMQQIQSVRFNITSEKGDSYFIPSLASDLIIFPANVSTYWPFNLPVFSVVVLYALAEPLTLLNSTNVAVFTLTTGVPVEFAFSAKSISGDSLDFKYCSGKCYLEDGVLYAKFLEPGLAISLEIYNVNSKDVVLSLLLFSQDLAARSWVLNNGVTRLFISDELTEYILNDSTVQNEFQVHTNTVDIGSFSVYPAPKYVSFADNIIEPVSVGVFSEYFFKVPPPVLDVSISKISEASSSRIIPKGPPGYAEAPNSDGAFGFFEYAETFNISITGHELLRSDLSIRLEIDYKGDCARLYNTSSTIRTGIVMDHFFNGHKMVYPLTRDGYSGGSTFFTLRILPLAKNQPSATFPWGDVLFQKLPEFNSSGVSLSLDAVTVVQTFIATFVMED